MGIRKAAKAPITTWALKDLGLDPAALVPQMTWEASLPEMREVQCEFIGGTPAEQAAALVTKLFAQKIL